jgi:hypothetical protein
MKTIIAAGCMACALAAISGQASAGSVIGGSTLLDASGVAQLERWLGAGQFNLQNVYTRRPGDTSLDFHAGADARGATFTLLEVTNGGGQTYLVGGYNPQSWASDEGWHETERDWQRTAFLFNMTEPAVYRQVAATYMLPSQGKRQTFNDADLGPVFGSGPDLYVNKTLDGAISWQLSYGNPDNEGISIVDGSLKGQALHVDALEIFAISPVPEPGSTAMLLAGMGVLGVAARRRARHRAR